MAGARGAARRQLVARALRRRNARRRTWSLPRVPWRVLGAVCATAAFAAAVVPAWRVVRNHSYFAVREVVIHHRGRLPERSLRAAVAVERGGRIWDVDTAAVAARVRSLPWVRSVTVRRELPDRVLVLVREYRPAAIVVVTMRPVGSTTWPRTVASSRRSGARTGAICRTSRD